MGRAGFEALNGWIEGCELCPRLRAHCRATAQKPPRRYVGERYFVKPVPNFGDPGGRLLVVGLAPAAHGANRTGRMFTGDRSGDWLYRAMHEAGFASQATATGAGDGLALRGAVVTAAAHCAPPQNKPTAEELGNCSGFLDATFDVLPGVLVVVCLGRIGFTAVLKHYRRRGLIGAMSGYAFGHGARHEIPGAPVTLCSYHPSQQNTFTGRLTREMLLGVFLEARGVIDSAVG